MGIYHRPTDIDHFTEDNDLTLEEQFLVDVLECAADEYYVEASDLVDFLSDEGIDFIDFCEAYLEEDSTLVTEGNYIGEGNYPKSSRDQRIDEIRNEIKDKQLRIKALMKPNKSEIITLKQQIAELQSKIKEEERGRKAQVKEYNTVSKKNRNEEKAQRKLEINIAKAKEKADIKNKASASAERLHRINSAE